MERREVAEKNAGGVWARSIAPAPVDGIDSVADEPQMVSDSTEPTRFNVSALNASASGTIGAAMTSA